MKFYAVEEILRQKNSTKIYFFAPILRTFFSTYILEDSKKNKFRSNIKKIDFLGNIFYFESSETHEKKRIKIITKNIFRRQFLKNYSVF